MTHRTVHSRSELQGHPENNTLIVVISFLEKEEIRRVQSR
jgi:hypothetical protein